MISSRCVGLALAICLSACNGATAIRHVGDQPSGLYVLTARDLCTWSTRSLYDVIAELRPNFVRPNLRGEPPTLFVNGMLAGSIEVLHALPTDAVSEVRLLRGADATARHGSVHTGSILEVTLRSR